MQDAEGLPGTVKLHHRHLVVLTADATWPDHLEDGSDLAAAMVQEMQRHEERTPGIKVTAGACAGADDGVDDVLVFPDMIRHRSVRTGQAADLVRHYLAAGEPSAAAGLPPGAQTPESLSGRHLFVCIHGDRDERCGKQGPDLLSSLRQELVHRGTVDVTVRGSSHVGGHKFAGCMLAYPAGDWYGQLDAALAGTVVEECVVADRILEAHWRGRLGMTVDDQLATAAAWS